MGVVTEDGCGQQKWVWSPKVGVVTEDECG
jgi:hypothetical protein